MRKPAYHIKAKVWQYNGPSAWHFISLPAAVSKEIKKLFGEMAAGFGSLPVMVTIGKTQWKTSIFPDTKSNTYILPVKLMVRKRENIKNGQIINFSIEIQI